MRRSIVESPIHIVDRNAAGRVINAVILNHYRNGKNWEYAASDELKQFGIHISPSQLKKYFYDLKRERRDARAASCFNGKIVSRSEKDGMYREVDALASYFLAKPISYVGLPANQLVHVSRKYDSVVACERNTHMLTAMRNWAQDLVPRKNAEVVSTDIVEYLQTTDKKFSLFDIDLMTYINQDDLVSRLVAGIVNSAEDTAIVCLVTCVGRKISQDEYDAIMPHDFTHELECCGKTIIHHQPGGYVDQVVPMRYEILVVEE